MPEDGGMTQDLSAVAWPVDTARLRIRPAAPEDADAMFAIRSRPEVAEWLPVLPSDAAAYAERFREPERLALTLALELDGELIGDLYLALTDAWAQVEVREQAQQVQAEIGWVVSPEHAGRGYATECAEELLRICFEDLGLRRVKALCFADNVASWRIMEKVGMRREEYNVAESLHRSGKWLDGVGYAILADEWRARRSGRVDGPGA
jgi:RimJ/RimL family protein N-acetyltransferase